MWPSDARRPARPTVVSSTRRAKRFTGMGSISIIREKCLLVKEKWAIELTVVDASGNVRFLVVGRAPMNQTRFSRRPAVAAGVSFAWWYWDAPEEASALA